jgi:hypothetical protein
MPGQTNRRLNSKDLKDARAAVGRASRQVTLHPNDAERKSALTEAQREYNMIVAEHFIQQVIESAPPLTSAQRTTLAAMLVPPARRKVQR